MCNIKMRSNKRVPEANAMILHMYYWLLGFYVLSILNRKGSLTPRQQLATFFSNDRHSQWRFENKDNQHFVRQVNFSFTTASFDRFMSSNLPHVVVEVIGELILEERLDIRVYTSI
jgi:hypothetical protein